MGVTEYACRLYREGHATLGQAADIPNVAPREMLEILGGHGMRGDITLHQQRQAIKHVTGGLNLEYASR